MSVIEMYKPENLEARYEGFRPTPFDPHIRCDLNHFWIAPVSLNRDSGCLETSNWEVVTKDILSKAIHGETEVHRFGHWACGWFELLLIHPNDDAALECADEWSASLSQNPVANEEYFSGREWGEKLDYWNDCSISERVKLCQRAGASIFAARHDTMPENVDMHICIN